GVVRGIRPRLLVDVPRLELVVPVLDARRFRREKLVVVHGTPPRPHAVRPAEIGDAARRRDAGARKDEDALRPPERLDEPRVERHRARSITPLPRCRNMCFSRMTRAATLPTIVRRRSPV